MAGTTATKEREQGIWDNNDNACTMSASILVQVGCDGGGAKRTEATVV
jgi:hypothetical protein